MSTREGRRSGGAAKRGRLSGAATLREIRKPARFEPARSEGPTGQELAQTISRQIRSLRKARGMTLMELASRTGLSIGYVSQIERNLSSPSVVALHAISSALGVNIGSFFSGGEVAPPDECAFIVRADRRHRVSYASGIVDQLLSPNLEGQLELLMSRFQPGATSGEKPYTHQGEEAGIVIAGQFELWVDDKHFMLGEGDSFTFPSTLPHRYRNPGGVETVVIWAITPPSY